MAFQALANVLGRTFEIAASPGSLFVEAALVSAHFEMVSRDYGQASEWIVRFRGGFEAQVGRLVVTASMVPQRRRRPLGSALAL